MLTNSSYTGRRSAHLRSLQNHRWLVLFAMLILLLMARQASTAQTVEAPSVTVTGEAVATPTPHDNWHAMRQHIMPEVTKNLRLIAGITNLTDEKYYDRLFANGIEPAPRRCGYAGVSLSF